MDGPPSQVSLTEQTVVTLSEAIANEFTARAVQKKSTDQVDPFVLTLAVLMTLLLRDWGARAVSALRPKGLADTTQERNK